MAKQKRRPPDPDLLTRLARDMALAVRLFFDRRVGTMAKLIPLAMIGYIISPLDLIPDLFLPFGVFDDLSAFLVGLQLFIRSAPPEVVQEYREGKRKGYYDDAPRRAEPPQVLEGEYEIRDDE